MLDLTLARIAQHERELEIERRYRLRAIREASAPCARDAFVPPAPGSPSRPALRPASTLGAR